MAALNVNERVAPALNLIANEISQREKRWSTSRVSPGGQSSESRLRERLAELAVTSGGDEGALKTCLSPRLFIRLFNGKVASCMQHFMYSIPMFPDRPVLF